MEASSSKIVQEDVSVSSESGNVSFELFSIQAARLSALTPCTWSTIR